MWGLQFFYFLLCFSTWVSVSYVLYVKYFLPGTVCAVQCHLHSPCTRSPSYMLYQLHNKLHRMTGTLTKPCKCNSSCTYNGIWLPRRKVSYRYWFSIRRNMVTICTSTCPIFCNCILHAQLHNSSRYLDVLQLSLLIVQLAQRYLVL